MYELKVEGMTCGGCVRSVTKSVQSVDGNARVDVDLPSGRVRIDSAAQLDAVKNAIEDAGYTVTSATPA
ncbi:heavy-metal-associated domain-containing protein [Noviherbaspirillum pedocola]|uniref:Heavy-metal-associated domain-containing protein n=1 Tax=Noviherbaspirillum pedocola TaxID=2801341 RepID=A0A934W987_9BURK|nr:cation transporter [Noviherbaspirillum pedocola]MBK4737773.1 heavy-metal-associated domain-containing protein [Noviherbaspirillum pedocola]